MKNYEPEVTLLVAAFNERDWIEQKVVNSLGLEYPPEKLHCIFVTDGSTDGTEEVLRRTAGVTVFHNPERRGKLAAVDRVMPMVTTPIVIFSDANTLLNREVVRNIVRHFADSTVGGVAGEKRILQNESDTASGAGEGMYWRYESALKKMDSDLYSVVGAAGELFAIRTELYESLPLDTIIEDFVLSLRIAQRGFRVIYEPDAYALEVASVSVTEELKRKTRIAAGGFQSIRRLSGLLNPFRYGLLSFEYISHRVLRWAVAPFMLPLLLVSNLALCVSEGLPYVIVAIIQCAFYGLAYIGWVRRSSPTRHKIFFTPLYFLMMNVAVYRGLRRYITGTQSSIWERAQRAQMSIS